MDSLYTNGVIAVKEKNLLNDRLPRLCEMGAEEAFRALVESGFGNGAEAADLSEVEALIAADERDIDAFVREYSPSDAERQYLLSPRDFHNAKALIKAEFLSEPADKMLAPEGLISCERLLRCVRSGEFKELPARISEAMEKANALLSSDSGEVSGAKLGAIFERAKFNHLSETCRRGILKKFVTAKADMTNILTALRSPDEDFAKTMYVGGGKLSCETLSKLFVPDGDKAARALDGTPYAEFYAKCLEAKSGGLPLSSAERELDSLETDYFYERRYELKDKEPFLYYVFRRRAENADVRIVFVCLSAGMKEAEIKRRLRAF